jgi:membrane protease YdiL (CAAX protease family)
LSEIKSIWRHPTLYFITRMFILLGMMLMFGGLAYSIAVYTSKGIFGVDLMSNPSLMNDYSNPQVVNALKYVQALAAIGIFIIPSWHFAKAINRTPADYLKINRKTTVSELGIALAILIAVTPLISWLIYINQKIVLPPQYQQLEQQLKLAEQIAQQLTQAFLNVSTPMGLLSNIIVIAVIAAIGEEFLFRGVLQTFMRSVTNNAHVSVIFVAVVFSAFHGQFYGSIPRFVLGLILGYAFLFTGNLWISIFIHFMNNALAVIFSYPAIQQQLPAQLQQNYTFEAWYINLGSAVATILLLWLLRKTTKNRVWYNGE